MSTDLTAKVTYFLGHDKLRLIRLVYQVYLYGFFSIAQLL